MFVSPSTCRSDLVLMRQSPWMWESMKVVASRLVELLQYWLPSVSKFVWPFELMLVFEWM